MSQPSPLYPYLRAIAKLCTIPGTNIGLAFLTDIQDQLTSDDDRRQLSAALDHIRANTAAALDLLRENHDPTPPEDQLSAAALQIAQTFYLQRLADRYLYADFKGIEQLERLIPLKLDDIFVDLHAIPERSSLDLSTREAEILLRRAAATDHPDPRYLEEDLADLDAHRLRLSSPDAHPQPIGHFLRSCSALIILGPPGSGKTTLVKRLARSAALQSLSPSAAAREGEASAEPPLSPSPATPLRGEGSGNWQLPLGNCSFPIILPLASYIESLKTHPNQTLFDHLHSRMTDEGGQSLDQAFFSHWIAGTCLILLDGLDEIVDSAGRIAAARAIESLLQQPSGNRLLITSRPIGYSICRINAPGTQHILLQPFTRPDIETFARHWLLGFEKATHPDAPNLAQAAAEAADLIRQIESNPRVESLATNPLMLTIIALIKHQNITLPDRRVKLYEIALNTLIRSWNKARSLANRPVGQDLSLDETKKVWSLVAHWMHKEKSTGACTRQALIDKLVEILLSIGIDSLKAHQTAESYLSSATERAGLLDERGPNIFAFMHLTFEEYLAARHLAMPHSKAIQRAKEVAPNPRWHEVIRLAAGYIGVIQQDDEMVTDFVSALLDVPDDPLEPFLCTRLRLAAACIADDTRVKPQIANAIVIKICGRLSTLRYEPLTQALTASLQSMRRVTPDSAAIKALIGLDAHQLIEVRIEGARMLARAGRNPDALNGLKKLFADQQHNLRAHGAFGLWLAGDHSVAVAMAIARIPDPDFRTLLRQSPSEAEAIANSLMAQSGAAEQAAGARLLCAIGQQSSAVPVLLRLLNAGTREVVRQPLRLLHQCRPDPQAVSLISKLLEHPDSYVKLAAAETLDAWGYSEQCVPVLRKLLHDRGHDVEDGAFRLLKRHRVADKVVERLLELLTHQDKTVRRDAAWRLAELGHLSKALPIILQLAKESSPHDRVNIASNLLHFQEAKSAKQLLLDALHGDDPDASWYAAQFLSRCGGTQEAIPVLEGLLRQDSSYIREQAVRLLFEYGQKDKAIEEALRLQAGPDTSPAFRMSELLASFGEKKRALPGLLAIFNGLTVHAWDAAASLLGQRGPGDGAAQLILIDLLTGEDLRRAVTYLDSLDGSKLQPADKRTATLLATLLTPNPADPPRRQHLRQILFAWLWQTTIPTP